MIDRLIPLMPVVIGAAADQMLPAPDHSSSVGWLVLTAAGVLTIVKLCLDTWKEHFREVPRPSETYVTITNFEKSIQEVTERIETAVQKIETFSSSNYQARSRMHKKINGLQNAFQFLCGTLSRDGRPHDAKHIRTIIENQHEDDDEG